MNANKSKIASVVERYPALDIIRGLALFGVLMDNLSQPKRVVEEEVHSSSGPSSTQCRSVTASVPRVIPRASPKRLELFVAATFCS
jgi:uncharacterized membrane protein YeiB